MKPQFFTLAGDLRRLNYSPALRTKRCKPRRRPFILARRTRVFLKDHSYRMIPAMLRCLSANH